MITKTTIETIALTPTSKSTAAEAGTATTSKTVVVDSPARVQVKVKPLDTGIFDNHDRSVFPTK